MSLENVADLIAKPPEVFVPEPRYVSKYREKIRRAAKRGKSAHKTLGVPSVNLNPPTEFLKKNSKGFATRPVLHHEHYHRPGYQHKLPDWQPIKAAEKGAPISQSRSIDFTKRNVDEAKNLRPSKARKFYVDDRHGSAHPLRTSGLFPVYRNRKNFGEVPGSEGNAASPQKREKIREENRDQHLKNQREDKSKIEKLQKEYKIHKGKDKPAADKLSERAESTKTETKDSKPEIRSIKSTSSQKRDLHDERDEESVASSRPQQPRCRYVTEDERAELLYGMKKKWDEMMKQFQCLPFMTDTPPKAKRKSQMEKDLHQLEKDIEVIERHPYIYVYSDAEDSS